MTVAHSKGGVAMNERYSAKLRARNQLTLNPDLVKQLNLDIGDELEFVVIDGKLVGIPKVSVDKSQAWYWTPAWQEAERESEEELRQRIATEFKGAQTFTTVDDFLDELKK